MLHEALEEPDKEILTAGALLEWYDRVSKSLVKCGSAKTTAEAREISRRMCFIKCPDLYKLSGWEDIPVSNLLDISPDRTENFMTFARSMMCSQLLDEGFVDTPFFFTMWGSQVHKLSFPDGEMLPQGWAERHAGPLVENLKNHKLQHEEPPTLKKLIATTWYSTDYGKSYLKYQEAEKVNRDKQRTKLRGSPMKRKIQTDSPDVVSQDQHAADEENEVLAEAVGVSNTSGPKTPKRKRKEQPHSPLTVKKRKPDADFAGSTWSIRRAKQWVTLLHTHEENYSRGKSNTTCSVCGKNAKDAEKFKGSLCLGFFQKEMTVKNSERQLLGYARALAMSHCYG